MKEAGLMLDMIVHNFHQIYILFSHVITEYPFSISDLFGAKLLSQSE